MWWPMLSVFLTHHQNHCVNVNFYLKKESCRIFLPTVLNFRLCYHSLISYHHPRKYRISVHKICCKLFSAVKDAGCSVKENEQGAIGDGWQGRDLTSQGSAYSDQAKWAGLNFHQLTFPLGHVHMNSMRPLMKVSALHSKYRVSPTSSFLGVAFRARFCTLSSERKRAKE